MTRHPTIDQILARRQEQVKDPLLIEEVFTLHAAATGEQELAEDERDRLLDRLRGDPVAAQQLLKLMQFPHTDALDDESSHEDGVSERWAEFRKQLIANGEAEEVEVAEGVEKARARALGPSSARRVLPLAASFLIGAVLALLAGSLRDTRSVRSDTSPGVNLPIIELSDDGSGIRRSIEPVRVPETADGVIVTLTTATPSGTPPFHLVVIDGTGTRLLEVPGLEPGPGGVFVLTLPRAAISGGTYQLDLLDRNGTGIATFLLEIAVDRDFGD